MSSSILPWSPHPLLHGWPLGYFMIQCSAMERVLDVEEGWQHDGTRVILFPRKKDKFEDNQLFFIDPSGVLCSKSARRAIDVADHRLVIRHPRPVLPQLSSASHPPPTFNYSRSDGVISVQFHYDPTPQTSSASEQSENSPGTEEQEQREYILEALPSKKQGQNENGWGSVNGEDFDDNNDSSPIRQVRVVAMQPNWRESQGSQRSQRTEFRQRWIVIPAGPPEGL